MGPAGYVDQSYPIFVHSLQIRMTERESGREVYKVSASNSGGESSLVRAMPYLIRSALADFPLGNGTVRTVKIPLDKTGGVSNESAGRGRDEREDRRPGACSGTGARSVAVKSVPLWTQFEKNLPLR